MALNKKRVDKKTNADLILEEQEKKNSENFSDTTLKQLESPAPDTSSDKEVEEVTVKKKPGRPTNASKGLGTRRQFSITLPMNVYRQSAELAAKDGVSFAKYVELALDDYNKYNSTSY